VSAYLSQRFRGAEVHVATELGGSQITTLMETLPGIANVLRSPVADAIINMIRAGVRLRDFQYADADELVKYAIRRNLLGNDEGERVLAEAKAAEQKRIDKAAERAQHKAHPPKKVAKPKTVAKAKATRNVKAVKPAKKAKPAKKR
jgi:NH3-dependent NAD+ synthetase